MKLKSSIYSNLMTAIGIALLAGTVARSSEPEKGHDILYIGDGHDSADAAQHSTIKRFDATTGEYLGIYIQPIVEPLSNQSTTFLNGPRGIIVKGRDKLLVANQNQDQQYAGEIFEYKLGGRTGLFLRALVSHIIPGPTDVQNPDAPFVPRGIVLGQQFLFVASQQSEDRDNNGKVRAYNPQSGKLEHVLPNPNPNLIPSGRFHPAGVVIYQGFLYVTNTPTFSDNPQFKPDGQIIRYNLKLNNFNEFDPPKVFVDNSKLPDAHSLGYLSGPEGLVFGPDGNLYVISYRVDPNNDTDKVLVFAGPGNARPGSFLDKIDLDPVSANPLDRAAGSALLFGPEGNLYVPITGPGTVNHLPPGFSTGEVRRYNVHNKAYTILVPSFLRHGPMEEPWYLTFGKTNPATLAYEGHDNEQCR